MATVGRHRKEKRRPPPTPGLGQRIRDLRQDQRLSQEELAERADLSTTYVSELERNRRDPSLSTLLKLAYGLHVDPAELLRSVQKAVDDEEAILTAVRKVIESGDADRLRRLRTLIEEVFR